jgi:hypothetical protein
VALLGDRDRVSSFGSPDREILLFLVLDRDRAPSFGSPDREVLLFLVLDRDRVSSFGSPDREMLMFLVLDRDRAPSFGSPDRVMLLFLVVVVVLVVGDSVLSLVRRGDRVSFLPVDLLLLRLDDFRLFELVRRRL